MYASAALDSIIGLYMVIRTFESGSTFGRALTPLKLFAMVISFQKKTEYDVDDSCYPTIFDLPTCFLEVVFFMLGNTEWWLTVFVEQPLHW